MASITQTKDLLGVFRGDELHTFVDSPGATTFYDDQVYTVVEGNTVDDVVADKSMPSRDKLEQAMPSATKLELEAAETRLIETKVVKIISK